MDWFSAFPGMAQPYKYHRSIRAWFSVVDDHSHTTIDPAQCHGWGTCVAECPGKAITLARYTDDQLIVRI